MGLMIAGFKAHGIQEVQAFQCALAVFLGCCLVSYGYFLKHKSGSR
jgi:hypothetical protein